MISTPNLETHLTELRGCTHRDLPTQVARGIVDAGPHAIEPLLPLIANRNNGRVAMHAVTLLGWIGDARVAPALIGLLQDADGDIDFYAEEALERIGADATPALLHALPTSPDSIVPLLQRIHDSPRALADALICGVLSHGPIPALLRALEAMGLECGLLDRIRPLPLPTQPLVDAG